MARKVELTPPADDVARCIHAGQSVTFVARGARRLWAKPTVTFVLVPLHHLQHSDKGPWTRGDWLVWQDQTNRGVVGRLPAGGAEIATNLMTPGEDGRLAGAAFNEVIDAVWRIIAE